MSVASVSRSSFSSSARYRRDVERKRERMCRENRSPGGWVGGWGGGGRRSCDSRAASFLFPRRRAVVTRLVKIYRPTERRSVHSPRCYLFIAYAFTRIPIATAIESPRAKTFRSVIGLLYPGSLSLSRHREARRKANESRRHVFDTFILEVLEIFALRRIGTLDVIHWYCLTRRIIALGTRRG